jgi:hypothetical protein
MISQWFPGTGEVRPFRYKGWWVQYPEPSCSARRSEPSADLQPLYSVGDLVRLVGKPDCIREVLVVEWHCHRYEYVYVVETSAQAIVPYWFAPQLVREPPPSVPID